MSDKDDMRHLRISLEKSGLTRAQVNREMRRRAARLQRELRLTDARIARELRRGHRRGQH